MQYFLSQKGDLFPKKEYTKTAWVFSEKTSGLFWHQQVPETRCIFTVNFYWKNVDYFATKNAMFIYLFSQAVYTYFLSQKIFKFVSCDKRGVRTNQTHAYSGLIVTWLLSNALFRTDNPMASLIGKKPARKKSQSLLRHLPSINSPDHSLASVSDRPCKRNSHLGNP